jgi:hypothetical protein
VIPRLCLPARKSFRSTIDNNLVLRTDRPASPTTSAVEVKMSLLAVYERFLASPNPLSLTETASLHYVPTLTSFSQSGPVIRHLENQNKNVVKIKSQKVLNAVEGASSLAIELDATLTFLSDGGAYLPTLDNFVVDKTVTFPLVSQCTAATLQF